MLLCTPSILSISQAARDCEAVDCNVTNPALQARISRQWASFPRRQTALCPAGPWHRPQRPSSALTRQHFCADRKGRCVSALRVSRSSHWHAHFTQSHPCEIVPRAALTPRFSHTTRRFRTRTHGTLSRQPDSFLSKTHQHNYGWKGKPVAGSPHCPRFRLFHGALPNTKLGRGQLSRPTPSHTFT